MTPDVIKTIVILSVASFVTMIILGATKKVVIYYNFKDFFVSLVPFLALILALVLILIYSPDSAQKVPEGKLSTAQNIVLVICMGIALISIVYSFILSVRYNRNIAIGLIVGVFKVLIAILGFLLIASEVASFFDEKTSFKRTLLSAVYIAAFLWIGKLLINGPEVYYKKGWSLPLKS